MSGMNSIETFHAPDEARESSYSGVHARFFRGGEPSFVIVAESMEALEKTVSRLGETLQVSSDLTRHDILLLSPHSKLGKATIELAGIPDPAAFVERAKRIEKAAADVLAWFGDGSNNPIHPNDLRELRTALALCQPSPGSPQD